MESKQRHYTHQKKYFEREYSGRAEYSLSGWEESYVKRIKRDLLGKSYKGKKLIDIGTGSGYVAVEMAKLGLNVLACDLTEIVIRNLKRYKKKLGLKNLHIVTCKAEDIPLPDKSVDFVVANAVLEHIPDELMAVNEWKRILKHKGKIFITVPLKFRYIWPFLWPLNYVLDKRIGHLRRYDNMELERVFGMKAEKVYYTGHFIKALGFLMLKFYKSDNFEKYIEKNDAKKIKKRYGAINVGCILRRA